MSSRLETQGVAVQVVPVQGPTREAVFFLRTRGAQGRTLETLAERLDAPQTRFLPLEVDGEIQLRNIDAIAYVEHYGELEELARLAELGAWRVPAVLVLTNGTILRGDLVFMLPPERRRVSDLLNGPGRFVMLVDDTLCRHVNRSAIECVRGLEPDDHGDEPDGHGDEPDGHATE